MPSRLPYSPLLRDCDGADSLSEDSGRIEGDEPGRLGRLADLRDAGRDFGVAERGRDDVDPGLADALDAAGPRELPADRDVDPAGPMPAGRDGVLRDDVLRDEARDAGRAGALRDEVLDDVLRDDGLVDDVRRVDGLRGPVARDGAGRRAGGAGIDLADDIVLAATVSAFAAVIMAFVAVFIDFIAVDIVWADAVALVAAAVILVAADVTLVAADDTPLAAVIGVAELRLPRLVVLLRAVLEPERDAVDRDAVLPVDRDPALRVLALAITPLVEPAALLRVDRDLVPDDLEPELDLGRLAVPLDALRLTDLLRAALAELRRVAARVVD